MPLSGALVHYAGSELPECQHRLTHLKVAGKAAAAAAVEALARHLCP